ncbi:hypothetical protein UY3_17750 [Chelonia mydas]|uniref:Uncharacterized protein n=1 Tax=Chelonia mydas TaxID=8469 RepID=M7AL43_CHEMY|nr:hypothetical protein UY3_17750 [Chelonia mydas]
MQSLLATPPHRSQTGDSCFWELPKSSGSQSWSAACSGKAPGAPDQFVYHHFPEPPLGWSGELRPVGAAISRTCGCGREQVEFMRYNCLTASLNPLEENRQSAEVVGAS